VPWFHIRNQQPTLWTPVRIPCRNFKRDVLVDEQPRRCLLQETLCCLRVHQAVDNMKVTYPGASTASFCVDFVGYARYDTNHILFFFYLKQWNPIVSSNLPSSGSVHRVFWCLLCFPLGLSVHRVGVGDVVAYARRFFKFRRPLPFFGYLWDMFGI
jgi:hypothetical protein